MTDQVDLLQSANQKYVIDSCALLDFWGSVKGYRRSYDVDVQSFRVIWNHMADQVANGIILVPEVVYKEVDKTTVKEFHKWLLSLKNLFIETDEAVTELGAIVQEIPFYTTAKANLQDAILVAIAKNRKLTVITSEHKEPSLNYKKPMIPNVCDKFNVKWLSLPQYFKEEGL